jgi:hypothetical protein
MRDACRGIALDANDVRVDPGDRRGETEGEHRPPFTRAIKSD